MFGQLVFVFREEEAEQGEVMLTGGQTPGD